MIQIKTVSCFLLLLPISYVNSAQASKEKIEICNKLFQESEQIIAEAEKQPGTHLQVEKIKQQVDQVKKDIFSMEKTIQAKTCELGLAKLEELK